MRDDLGDGYTEALRAAYPEVPESADFVRYWWHKAAAITRAGGARRFGLITTNSLRQTFNRRVVETHLKGNPVRLPPGEKGPWSVAATPQSVAAMPRSVGATPLSDNATPCSVDAMPLSDDATPCSVNATPLSDDAAPPSVNATPLSVVAMPQSVNAMPQSDDALPLSVNAKPTGEARKVAKSGQKPAPGDPAPLKSPVLSLLFAIPDHPWVDTAEGAAVRIAMTVGEAGEHPGELRTATAEEPQDDGSAKVTLAPPQTGRIAADLTTGADLTSVAELKANSGLSCPGVKLHGSG